MPRSLERNKARELSNCTKNKRYLCLLPDYNIILFVAESPPPAMGFRQLFNFPFFVENVMTHFLFTSNSVLCTDQAACVGEILILTLISKKRDNRIDDMDSLTK